MRKIVTVLGARPQFIKASVVSHAIAQNDSLTEVLVHTGQHFDANMSDVFFEELGMSKPDYFLNIHSGNHDDVGLFLEQHLFNFDQHAPRHGADRKSVV